jgi:protein arginine kinase
MTAWYIEKGPDGDVVMSSRVRLARNLANYPFPMRMTKEQEISVVNNIRQAVSDIDKIADKIFYLELDDLNPVERMTFVEKHLVSHEFANSKRKKGVIIDSEEKISIMINEEDHLRIQYMASGMQLENVLEKCMQIDDAFEQKLSYAFDSNYGYLTSCPTNVGTGLRASVMLHLPALTITGHIKGILDACGKLGMAVRGLYGENSEASGNLYQISNQVTLGYSDIEIVRNLNGIVSQIIEQEKNLCTELQRQNPYRLEDRIYRSKGIFENARILTTEEAMKLISDLRLGIFLGLISDLNTEMLNEIMVAIQPANLQKIEGKLLTTDERDVKRAEIIKKIISSSLD